MRFVVLSNLVGIAAASVGFVAFDLGWLAALAIWMLSGPAGAALAILSVSAPATAASRPPVEVAVQSRAA
jgi:hypothetical protein